MIRSNRRRRGYALIELLVLITVVAVLLGLCAGMIHLLLKLDRVGRAASDEAADMARLGRDFRDDAHASASIVEADPPRGGFTMTLEGGRSAHYEARPGDILRTVTEAGNVRHRETYRRPARSSVRLEKSTQGPATIASLIVAAGESRPGREVRIDAVLGLDVRQIPRAP